jgi:hypothetical protein
MRRIASVFMLVAAMALGLSEAPVRGQAAASVPSLPVIMYHHVGNWGVSRADWAPWVVRTEDFAAQLDWLRAHGYRTVTFEQFAAETAGGRHAAGKPVVISFDDGWAAQGNILTGPEVIDAVAGSAGDLGIFPAHPDQTSGSWWIPLSGPDKPKIIARLPFVERTDHPAGTPIYVISKPIDDATVREVILYSLNIERWREGLTQALRRHDASIEASAGDDNGLSLLIAAPGSVSTETLADALGGLGIGRFEWHEIGSHAARYHRPDQH